MANFFRYARLISLHYRCCHCQYHNFSSSSFSLPIAVMATTKPATQWLIYFDIFDQICVSCKQTLFIFKQTNSIIGKTGAATPPAALFACSGCIRAFCLPNPKIQCILRHLHSLVMKENNKQFQFCRKNKNASHTFKCCSC